MHIATRIAYDDCASAGGQGVVELLIGELGGDLRMCERVQTGCSATAIGIGHLGEFDTFDASQDGARLFSDLLPVREVTRVLIGHARATGKHTVARRKRPE